MRIHLFPKICFFILFSAAILCSPGNSDEENSSYYDSKYIDSPYNLKLISGDSSVIISWAPIQNATSYNIYWNNNGNISKSDNSIKDVESPYSHTGLSNGLTYYYAVTAVRGKKESSLSNEMGIIPAKLMPAVPYIYSIESVDSGNILYWYPAIGALTYNLYWNTGGGVEVTDNKIEDVGSPFLHEGLTNGSSYYYSISSVNEDVESYLSNEVIGVPEIPMLGGKITGLIGTGIIIELNGTETLNFSNDSEFTFSAILSKDDSYSVVITQQPTGPDQNCIVINGSGTFPGVTFRDIEVTCSVQIASFNLEWFSSADSNFKKQSIADIIIDNGFDLVGLQEVSSGYDVGNWIAEYLDSETWDYAIGNSGFSQRVGIIYRKNLFNVSDFGELEYNKSGGYIDDNSYAWNYMRLPYYAKIDINSSTVSFEIVVVHFKAFDDFNSCDRRNRQVDDVNNWIINEGGDKIIVTGDFNDEIPGYGICSPGDLIDTLSSFESNANLTFITEQPTYMETGLYTQISYA